jgi:hypothetical protein
LPTNEIAVTVHPKYSQFSKFTQGTDISQGILGDTQIDQLGQITKGADVRNPVGMEVQMCQFRKSSQCTNVGEASIGESKVSQTCEVLYSGKVMK